MFNGQSICNKLLELNLLLSSDNVDIVCITETWLKSSLPDSCIANTNYWSVFRSDRTDRPGGGVCILTRNATVTASGVKFTPLCVDIQVCAVDLYINNIFTRLINVYRPPASDGCPVAVEAMKQLLKCLCELCDCSLPVLLAVDFN